MYVGGRHSIARGSTTDIEDFGKDSGIPGKDEVMKKFADDPDCKDGPAGSVSQTDAISKRMRMNAIVVGLPDPSTPRNPLTPIILVYPGTII